jgi:4-hydroxy-tetrahydrodipicolinate synthase
MPPPFFPMSPDDVLAYFLHVAEAVDLPVMLYNFPELAGKRIDLATIAAFADRAPMCAIKQSGGEFAYHRDLIALGREKNYAVMSGADTRLPEVFALGAAGCTGGLVNIVPELMVELVHAALDGDLSRAKRAQQTVAPLARIIYDFGEPGCGAHQRMKVARWLMGKFPSPHFRRPVRPLPPEKIKEIRRRLEEIGFACPI